MKGRARIRNGAGAMVATAVAGLVAAVSTAVPATAASAPGASSMEPAAAPGVSAPGFAVSCEGEAGFDALDFWVGEWDVYVGEQQVGSNRIAKILGGCAIVEEWTDARGGQGRSLFYYVPATGEWKQVWVTENATRPGGVKEKTLIAEIEGGVRFQGEIPLPDGGTVLDRTTLTPMAEGRVRQVIETSRDGGATWRTGFDAVYVRAGT